MIKDIITRDNIDNMKLRETKVKGIVKVSFYYKFKDNDFKRLGYDFKNSYDHIVQGCYIKNGKFIIPVGKRRVENENHR